MPGQSTFEQAAFHTRKLFNTGGFSRFWRGLGRISIEGLKYEASQPERRRLIRLTDSVCLEGWLWDSSNLEKPKLTT